MFFDDLVLGTTAEIVPVTINREKMMAFAYEYDNIPLHTDDAYARNTPFGQIIAQGVMSFMSVWYRCTLLTGKGVL